MVSAAVPITRTWIRPKTGAAPLGAPSSLRELKERERSFILEALTRTRGRIYGPDGAAALLGIKPTTLSSKVYRLGLKKFTR